MNNPKISIVIPVYNGEGMLRQCLDSVLHQTYENYEVVVVNNNSTDNTINIIKEFQQKNDRIKYVFEEKIGRGAARNSGIKRADGQIVAMTDCDCAVQNNWLEEITKPILHENENAVMGLEEDVINNYWAKNIQKANWNFIKRNLRGNYIEHIDTKNFAIKVFIIKKIMFDPELGSMEDLDLYLRLSKIAKIRFVSSIKVKHKHKNSFIKTIKVYFNRACSVTKIYKKDKALASGHPMFESISVVNFIQFPFWMIWQFLKKSPGEAFFLSVTEISWRAGILWALVK